MYDVIYLPELIRKFLKMGWVYTNLVPEVTCMINKYKRDPTNKFNNLEKFSSKYKYTKNIIEMQIYILFHLPL